MSRKEKNFNGKKVTRKDKRIIKKLLKKKEKIDKLKEEIEKMGKKLVLKDGKLVKVDDEQQKGVPGQPEPKGELPTPPPVSSEPKQQPVVQPQQQEEVYVEPRQQPVMPPPATEQAFKELERTQQQIPPQQFVREPQIQSTDLPEVVRVKITLINGEVLEYDVPGAELEGFMNEISEAINNQVTFQIGRDILNGRHIVKYSV